MASSSPDHASSFKPGRRQTAMAFPIWRESSGIRTATMLTTNPFDDDKLHEECGIFGIWGADDAASFVALGLHALQHRGQEAAGITSFDGTHFHSHRAMGHVAGNFDRDDVIRKLPGRAAIGHVRYSTTGETALRNVQPLFAELAEGGFAVAHNGNLSNAMKLRRTLNRRGSIFQSTSDTEVIIHLVATSTYPTPARPADRRAEAGRGRLFAAGPDRGRAGRLPRSARHPPAGHGQARRSDDLRLGKRRARRHRRHLPPRVEPGELVVVNDNGIRSFRPFAKAAAPPLHLRACLFLAARLDRRGQVGLRGAQEHRRRAGARGAGRGRLCRPRPRQRRARGDRLQPGIGHSVRARHHPLALCRPDLHPAAARTCATSASS